jgi:hypothetical protein
MGGTGASEWQARSRQAEKGGMGEDQNQGHNLHSFDTKRVVHKQFVLAGQTVNSAYCCYVSSRLRECARVRRLRPELWHQKELAVASQNTLSRISFLIREYFLSPQKQHDCCHPQTRLV